VRNPNSTLLDSAGNLYILDTGNNVIRKMLMPPSASLLLTASNIAPVAGQSLTLTATVSVDYSTLADTGTYAILDGTKTVCSGAGNIAHGFSCQLSTLTAGKHSLTATYAGTLNGLKATSPAVVVTVVLPVAATPKLTPAQGTYGSAQWVTIGDTTPSAAIYYTTNGGTPTSSSTKYTAPITIGVTATVKAIATATGYTGSGVASAAYTIIDSPSVLTYPATGIATPNANLNAAANDFGAPATVWFTYGASSTAMTSSTPKATLPAATSLQGFGAKLTGLAAKTTYYFQPVVSTIGGTGYGKVVSFTTN
jgi:hypothetical protein